MSTTMPIDAIVVGERHRRDLGDLSGLAESIRDLGLLQPIGVSPDGRLLFGERRLAACRLVGLADVPVHIVHDMNAAAERLLAERDENTCRKDMTVVELLHLGIALEAVERPKARARQAELNRPDASVHANRSKNTTREVVGAALGMSGTTYQRGKAVVTAAADEEAPDDVRQEAQEALAQMNETGKVTPAYDRVRRAQKAAASEPPAKATEQPKDTPDRRARNPRLHHKQAAKLLPNFLSQVYGIATAIEGVDFSGCRLDQQQVTELDASVRVILAARKMLKEDSK